VVFGIFLAFFFTDALDAVMMRAKSEKLDSGTNSQKFSILIIYSVTSSYIVSHHHTHCHII
jgi:sulfur relay (sulfurtransferase) DsrF/TusC family protein